MAQSAGESELVAIGEGLTLFERLLTLEWSPDEYQTYLGKREELRVSLWLPALRAHAQRLGLAFAWQGDAEALDAALSRAVRFYEVAERRDAEMVRRSLAKMDETQERIAVLIAGGFHTDHLRSLLIPQRVHVAVITPQIEQKTDQTLYAQILKYKHQMHTMRFKKSAMATDLATSVR